MPDVFINYRTGDGDKSASTIQTELSHRFGDERIFRASKSIKPGESFPEELLHNVRRSAVLLAVIGPNWPLFPALHDEDDWVRREILEAYACGIRVIPVLEGRKTERLRAADLPAELAQLAEAQSLRLDLQAGSADLIRIGDRLAELVPSLKEADRTIQEMPAPGAVSNSVTEVNGTAVQSRDITGDVGSVVKNNQAPVHTGKGNIYQNSQHATGDGATYIAGDNQGGIRHEFGGSRRREDDDR